jgi:hypothetical protein
LTGTGGLFTRVGRKGGLLRNLNGFLDSVAPASTVDWGSSGPLISCLQTNFNNIAAQYASADQNLLDGLYTQLSSYRGAAAGLRSYLQQFANNVLVQQVNEDTPLPSPTAFNALTVLIAQMIAGSASVAAPTVAITSVTAGGSNNTNGVCVASVIQPNNGIAGHYTFAETINVTCTSSSQEGSALGSELFSVQGAAAISDVLNENWPAGSGCSTSLQAIPSGGSPSNQKLANSGLSSFTVANTPDQWPLVSPSVAGTDVLSSTTSFLGSPILGLKFLGQSGATLSQVAQAFGSSLGTTQTLKPLTTYAFNIWLLKDSGATGVLECDLYSNTGSAIMQDAAGNNNAVSVNMTALSSSVWTSVSGFFRTPAALPASYSLRIHLTTTLNSAHGLYLGNIALAPAVQAYTGGPWLAMFPGNVLTIKNDTFAVLVANDYGSAWQQTADRFWSLRLQGFQLPTSGSPTIAESLIA